MQLQHELYPGVKRATWIAQRIGWALMAAFLALVAIEQLEVASAQFYEIARQNGPRPDYAPEPPPPREGARYGASP